MPLFQYENIKNLLSVEVFLYPTGFSKYIPLIKAKNIRIAFIHKNTVYQIFLEYLNFVF